MASNMMNRQPEALVRASTHTATGRPGPGRRGQFAVGRLADSSNSGWVSRLFQHILLS